MTQLDTVLAVSGMSCPSCVHHVASALAAVPGVSTVDVQLKAGTVDVRHDADASTSAMIEALGDAGYDAEVRSAAAHGGAHA